MPLYAKEIGWELWSIVSLRQPIGSVRILYEAWADYYSYLLYRKTTKPNPCEKAYQNYHQHLSRSISSSPTTQHPPPLVNYSSSPTTQHPPPFVNYSSSPNTQHLPPYNISRAIHAQASASARAWWWWISSKPQAEETVCNWWFGRWGKWCRAASSVSKNS